MQRRRLVQQVHDALGSATERVAYPDHPLLLRGPDVLAVTHGVLTAFFVYNGHGARPTSREELARYLLTRLALPRGARCVLVLDPSLTEDFHPSQTLLDDTLAFAEVGQYVRTASTRTTPAADVVESVRVDHNARFADTWTRAFDDRRRRAEQPRASTPTGTTAAPASRSSRLSWLQVDNGVIYAQALHRTGRELRRALDQTTVAAASLDYDLGRGLTGVAETASQIRSAKGHLAVHHLSSKRSARARVFDALKPQRAAAFAGIEVDSFEEGE